MRPRGHICDRRCCGARAVPAGHLLAAARALVWKLLLRLNILHSWTFQCSPCLGSILDILSKNPKQTQKGTAFEGPRLHIYCQTGFIPSTVGLYHHSKLNTAVCIRSKAQIPALVFYKKSPQHWDLRLLLAEVVETLDKSGSYW